jgi:hypothetical protein
MEDETTIKISLEDQTLTVIAKKGEQGERGEDGQDADEEEIIERVLPVVLEKVPTAEDVAKLIPTPENGKDGRDGKDGIDAIGEKGEKGDKGDKGDDGKDGSPDTAEQVKDKLLSVGIKYDEIQDTPDIPQIVRNLSSKTTSLSELDDVNLDGLTQTNGKYNLGSGGETPTLQQVTDEGATTTVESTFSGGLITPQVKASSSAGLDLKSNSGTDIGRLGAGDGAGVTWYGNHAFSQMTEGSIGFFGANGLLSQDNPYFYWNSTSRRLSVYSSLGTELLTNPNFTGNATGWTLGSGWAYSSNSVSKTSNGTAALSQSAIFNPNEEYIVSLVVSNLTAGTLTPTLGGMVQSAISANGTYTYRVIASTGGAFILTPSNTARLTVDTTSVKLLSGGSIRTGQLNTWASHSNSNPGTTYQQRFDNKGGNTWTEYRFNGTLRSAIGANSSGALSLYSSGSNGFEFYTGNSGLTVNTLSAYLYPSGFVHYGFGFFGDKVHAGATSTPHTTLQSNGGFAVKGRRITANTTLDSSATDWFVDASSAACNGTPTTPCSSYTNSTDCLARDAHGGCSWFAGYDCSVFNGDQSSCENQSGCTYQTASCSTFGDESTCNSTSGCSWTNNPQDCSVYNSDQSSCESTSGCTWNSSDCSSNFFDESSCNAQSGCSWDGTTCLGTYDTSCSGSYDSYTCEGSYFTGNCTGSYGSACSGTASCVGIDDSTNCNAESGCSWSTAVTVTLPSVPTCNGRHLNVYNDSTSGADVIIAPTSPDTINGVSSLTLADYKDAVGLTAFFESTSCSGLSEGTCGSTSGCTSANQNCIWTGSECTGGTGCDGYTDESSCISATYFECVGTYYLRRNWYIRSGYGI